MSKKKETIEIPMNLAKLLITEKEDLKDESKYEEVHTMARSLLKLLIAAV